MKFQSSLRAVVALGFTASVFAVAAVVNNHRSAEVQTAYRASGRFEVAHRASGRFEIAHRASGRFEIAHRASGRFEIAHRASGRLGTFA